MESEAPKSWEELRREEPLNERRVAVYRQLIEAQQLITAARSVHVGDAVVTAALEASVSPAPELESDEQLYVGTLTRFVEALGGELHGFRAEFPEFSITVAPFGRFRSDGPD
jgi:hypothetical protein